MTLPFYLPPFLTKNKPEYFSTGAQAFLILKSADNGASCQQKLSLKTWLEITAKYKPLSLHCRNEYENN